MFLKSLLGVLCEGNTHRFHETELVCLINISEFGILCQKSIHMSNITDWGERYTSSPQMWAHIPVICSLILDLNRFLNLKDEDKVGCYIAFFFMMGRF